MNLIINILYNQWKNCTYVCNWFQIKKENVYIYNLITMSVSFKKHVEEVYPPFAFDIVFLGSSQYPNWGSTLDVYRHHLGKGRVNQYMIVGIEKSKFILELTKTNDKFQKPYV